MLPLICTLLTLICQNARNRVLSHEAGTTDKMSNSSYHTVWTSTFLGCHLPTTTHIQPNRRDVGTYGIYYPLVLSWMGNCVCRSGLFTRVLREAWTNRQVPSKCKHAENLKSKSEKYCSEIPRNLSFAKHIAQNTGQGLELTVVRLLP